MTFYYFLASGIALFPESFGFTSSMSLTQEWSIDYWLNVGVPKDKLIVGIPSYGMSFTLADPSKNGVHARAVGGGRMGEYTRETGILAYYEVSRVPE